jgi:hypothetical protein
MSNSGIRTPDYERLNISWDSNVCYIEPTSAGTGTNRSLYLRSDGDSGLTIKANAVDIHANNWNTPKIIFGASNTTTYNTIRPVNNGIQGLGSTTNRWSEIFTETLTLGESVDTVVANSSGITIDGQDPSVSPFVVQGAVSQNTNLTEWQNSASTVLTSVGTDGTFSTASGEIHVYNSGYAIGATDYERIDIKYDGSNNGAARIVSAAGGSSTAKGMYIGTEANSLDLLTGGGSQFRWRFNNVVEYVITSASIRWNNTQKDLGTSSNTWGTTYSDNFIGDTMYASGVFASGVKLGEYEPPTAALKEQTLYSSGNQLAFNASGIPYSEPSGTLVGVASGVFNFLVINSGDYVALGSYEPETIYFVV